MLRVRGTWSVCNIGRGRRGCSSTRGRVKYNTGQEGSENSTRSGKLGGDGIGKGMYFLYSLRIRKSEMKLKKKQLFSFLVYSHTSHPLAHPWFDRDDQASSIKAGLSSCFAYPLVTF